MTTTTTRPGVRRALTDRGATGRLVRAALVDAVGTGLFRSAFVVYLLTHTGLSSGEVLLGLSVAAVCGLVCSVPISALGDRYPPVRLLGVLHAWRALWFCAYPFVTGFGGYLAVAVLTGIADRVASPVLQSAIGSVAPAGDRVVVMGVVRAVRNVGFTVGALTATGALALGWDQVVPLGNSASFAAAAVLVWLVPIVRCGQPERGRVSRTAVLRDRRYLLLAAVNGVLAMYLTVLSVGLPLWVTTHTAVDGAYVPLLISGNMVLAVLFQPVVASRVRSLRHAANCCLGSGLALAATCACLAVSATPALWLAITALVLAVATHTLGELLHSAGAWEISYDLAPPARRSVYLGVFNLGVVGQDIVGPSAMALCVTAGTLGWLTLGGVFALAGAAVVGLTRPLARAPARRNED
ncbi:MFS transporter [Actinokineospora diospyrosa]|uniref:Major Facilitator Superfamily protein n=1 Tax=Actinokineospora diospyrosa TaxID=103728 RepID=A0ABT1I9Q1_9PSEU|nr:MFS transporter [Actinokineospora diospyrosa]MCP2269363.1 Major Facilitator Superfamily protein [Actinokineospora diospyrosa]